jgi:hypothetical protein
MSRPLALLLTATLLFAMLLLPAPDAFAAPAPTVSPSTVKPGGSFTVSGTGCWDPAYDPAGGEEAQWYVVVSTAFGPGYFETTGIPGGGWTVTIQVSPTWPPGSGSVEAFCRLSNDVMFHYPKLWVTVPPPVMPPPAPGPSVPPPPMPRAPVSTAPGRPTPPATTSAAPAPLAPPTTAPSQGSTPSQAPAAQPSPAAAPDCVDCARLTDGTVHPGDALSLDYTGFQPGEDVAIVMRSTPVDLGTFTADADGVVTAEVRIPASAEVGSHTLTLSGPVTGEQVVGLRIARAERMEAGQAAEESVLPRLLGLGAAGLLVAVGVPLLLRRRTAAQPGPAGTLRNQPTDTPINEPIP